MGKDSTLKMSSSNFQHQKLPQTLMGMLILTADNYMNNIYPWKQESRMLVVVTD